jgi:hypothetical protein
VAVVPNDGNPLNEFNRELYIGAGGDVAVIMASNEESVIFTNVPDGARLPYVVTHVLATGTTASNIVAVW